MPAEVSTRVAFDTVRYAQCWEDADILVEALQPRPGSRFLSIASAGDNSLALLAAGASVDAIDLSAAQLHCVELRCAAYGHLDHADLLRLLGSRPATPAQRLALLDRCAPHLPGATRLFWQGRAGVADHGVGGSGKFERYFRIFRRVLALAHTQARVRELLRPKSAAERAAFHDNHWSNRRWRLLFQVFFSRRVMGWLGRDPGFFRYVEGSVADRILARTRHALVELDPSANPYLHWILRGTHGDALPRALRHEHFDAIRDGLGRLTTHQRSLEDHLAASPERSFDGFNLSDVFEYMSPDASERLLAAAARAGRPGARLVYWNMLAPRSRPESLAQVLRPLPEVAATLFPRDKAWFYSRLVVEEVIA
jgi:S-adenosylmethionine-diacylglycerol 3-amino-3-carboxypropyl transferase